MSEETAVTDDLLHRLQTDRTLTTQDRLDLLLDAVDANLLRDMISDRLNRYEQAIVMALTLDWPDGRVSAIDLARVVRMRTAPRRADSRGSAPDRSEPDVQTQLRWLRKKNWVRPAGVNAEGWDYWELVPENDDDE